MLLVRPTGLFGERMKERRCEHESKTKKTASVPPSVFCCIAAVIVCAGQVFPDVNVIAVLVFISARCAFLLLGTSLNLTLGYLGQLTLGHMGFAGIGAYTAALTSLALERAGLFEASEAAPGQLILVILGCCLLGAVFAGLLGAASWASRRCGCTVTIWPS